MTTPGGSGPIETAYVEIKPKVDPQFAADLRKQILPIIKKISKEANAAFQQIGASSKSASTSVSGLSRSMSGASKSASNLAKNLQSASGAAGGLKKASGSATTALRGTGGAAESAGRGARNAGTQFNFLARALIVGGVYEATRALKNLGTFGLGAAANLEQTKIAFTGLFGNAADAEAFTKRLQNFAKTTPFNFSELAVGSQRLLAIGQTGDQVIKTLTTVGNAAAAVGADQTSINRVITALAQIQAKGKLSAEEINQVGEALPNLNRSAVIQNLADTFGVTTAKIQEMQQKGLIPAKEGVDALLKSLDQVPGGLGAMSRQLPTLIGQLSNFKDSVQINFAAALQDSLPIIASSLGDLSNVVSTQLGTFGPALAQSLVTVTPFVEGFVNLIGPILTSVLSNLAPLLLQLTSALGPLGDAFSTVLNAFGPALQPLAAALAQLGIALAPVISSLGVQMANALVAATPLLIQFTQAIIPLLNYLAAHPTLIGDLALAFGAVFTVLKTATIIEKAVAAFKALAVVTFLNTVAAEGFSVALTANPIGIIVTAIAALVAGFVLLYRHSETVRKGFGALRDYGIAAIKFLIDAAINYFTLFIRAGAAAFGWVPGIGSKLRAAAVGIENLKNSINASLDGITRQVDINIVTHTYTIAEMQQNTRSAARQARINKGLQAIAPGGRINQLTPEEKAAVAAQVDAAIAAENKKAHTPSKPKPAPTGGGTPQFLPSSSSSGASKAASAAKKAAAAVHKALVKLADAALKAAKKVADGITAKLKTAKDALQKLRDQFVEIRDAIAKAFSVDLFASHSAKQFLKRASKNILNNTTVLANQQTLQAALGNKAGGSDFLRQLFESGNTRLIKSLATQSSATLNDVLAKFNQDAALADKIGTAVASAFVVGGRPLVVGIDNLRIQVITLQKALVIALAKVEAATKARDKLKAAAGGIFNSTTDLQVAEAGREVVVPLTRPKRALELLLQSGALGLPTVAAHMGSLENSAQAASMARLRAMGLPNSQPRQSAPAPLTLVPPVKVVKERTLHQTINITDSKDPRLTAASVAARTASHMDR